MDELSYTAEAVGYDNVFAHAAALFLPALLEAAHLAPRYHVLDVATGTGAAAQAAAAVVGPSGTVVAGDVSPVMLDVARRKLRDLPVTVATLDAHALHYTDGCFDAVICHLGLMLFADPARALAEFRRVLRPGGRVAVSVTTMPERTLFLRVGAAIARHTPERAKALNRCFDIADSERLHILLANAGFHDVKVARQCRKFSFASFDDYFGAIENGASLSGQEYVRLPEEVRRIVRDEVRRDIAPAQREGPLAIEMDVLIGSGQR